jgi:hypothetical protein
MPLASNWQASEIAAYYQRFVFSLGPSYKDEVHNAARAACAQTIGLPAGGLAGLNHGPFDGYVSHSPRQGRMERKRPRLKPGDEQAYLPLRPRALLP